MKVPSAHPKRAKKVDIAIDEWHGQPLRRALRFLVPPAILIGAVSAFGLELPRVGLYVFALIYGFFLVRAAFQDPEPLVAIAVLYIPFSRLFAASLAAGLNLTNLLAILMFTVLLARRSRDVGATLAGVPFVRLFSLWGAASLIAVITSAVTLGISHVLDRFDVVKAWFDQFIFFFLLLALIRDGKMARRVAVYMMIGLALVLVFGFQEWLERRNYASFDKSRLLGPQKQPNDLGAFIVYSVGPFLALFLAWLPRLRSLPLVLPLLVMARVLIATYSRGAYLGLLALGAAVTYARSKFLFVAVLVTASAVLFSFPQYLPDSVAARLNLRSESTLEAKQLDASSRGRLIVWDAAIRMTQERPLLGFGFASFPVLKDAYTSEPLEISDNHNMYLFVSSQFGVPALIILLSLLLRLGYLGLQLSKHGGDVLCRAIGSGALGSAAGALVINMFGSRLVDLCVMGYLWILAVVVARLCVELREHSASIVSGVVPSAA